MLQVVLIRPQIPPNTGNIARLCAATRCTLHLVGPLGFSLNDRALRRAGLDYWNLLSWKYYENIRDFAKFNDQRLKFWCVETGLGPAYYDVSFDVDSALVFGSETSGLTPEDLFILRAQCCHIPMWEPGVRSLNLSNSVAIVLYEALRQLRVETQGKGCQPSRIDESV